MPTMGAISAPTAIPPGVRSRTGGAHTSTSSLPASCSSSSGSGGPELGDRGAQTEGDHEVEECEPHQHRHAVAHPGALEGLNTVPPENERRADRERQREERTEFLELEEDLAHTGSLDHRLRRRVRLVFPGGTSPPRCRLHEAGAGPSCGSTHGGTGQRPLTLP